MFNEGGVEIRTIGPGETLLDPPIEEAALLLTPEKLLNIPMEVVVAELSSLLICIFRCCAKLSERLNDLPQLFTGHGNGLSPVWMRKWRLRCSRRLKRRWQN